MFTSRYCLQIILCLNKDASRSRTIYSILSRPTFSFLIQTMRSTVDSDRPGGIGGS